MKAPKCKLCGKLIEPNEETMHVETHCANFYLCSDCISESRNFWMARIDEVLANEEKLE